MSAPDQASQQALQRLTRYLQGSPRLVYSYAWQPESDLDVFVDTDFAGCMATRRSTSGGVAIRGTHLIKHWSSTQRAVTLSSAEAELYGLVKGTTEALGIKSWGLDLGLSMKVRMHADSAAAIGYLPKKLHWTRQTSGGGPAMGPRRATPWRFHPVQSTG